VREIMAFSLNRVTLIGNLGADPELRSTSQGTQVCSIKIATTERYKDKSGEWKDSTEWHNIVLWERLADTASKYLKKGSKVYVEGKLKHRSYEKDGITRYITEIQAQSLIMMSKESESGASQKPVDSSEDGFVQEDAPVSEENDDDVPF
jgi:single-strand DNA-binding protein